MRHQRNLQLLAVVLAGLLWAAATALSWGAPTDDVIETPWWVDFWSQNTKLDGERVPVGAVVRAYDPVGVECGEFTVQQAGWYGAMPVYGDDPQSPEDEGAKERDSIHFTIDGYPAIPVGPDSAEWTGLVRQVDLRACTLAGDFDCNCRVDVGDIQRVAGRWGVSKGQQGYYRPYDPDGDGIDVGDIQRVALAWRGTCP